MQIQGHTVDVCRPGIMMRRAYARLQTMDPEDRDAAMHREACFAIHGTKNLRNNQNLCPKYPERVRF